MEVGPKNSNVQKMATICEQNRYNREETKPAIALLRKSRLFPGKRVINNNRTLDLTLSLSFHFRRFPLLKPHPLSPSLFLLRSTTTPPPPHPAAFQGRSSRETEVKTRGCRVRVTFINNGTRDKPRPPPYYGVFLRSACRENPPSSPPPSPGPVLAWDVSDRENLVPVLSKIRRRYFRYSYPRRFLSPWDTAQVRNTLRDGSVAVSPVQYLMPPCNEGFCFPSGQNYT